MWCEFDSCDVSLQHDESRVLSNLAPPNTNATVTSSDKVGGARAPAAGAAEVVWTDFAGANSSESNMWAMYPSWPAEVLSLFSPPAALRVARASSLAYSTFATGRPALEPTAPRPIDWRFVCQQTHRREINC